MIRTLKNTIITTIADLKYDPEWTYIEVPNTAFTYEIDRAKLSDDITIDWGDGTIDHENTHVYAEVDDSRPSRIIKIQGVHIMMCVYHDIKRLEKISRTPFDAEHTIGLLSLEKFPDSFKDSQRKLDYICLGLEKTTSISGSFFDNCLDATSFKYALGYMKSLTSVPENLFSRCTEVENFSSTFEACEELNKIPEKLFANCRKVTDFSRIFCGCKKLKTVPAWIFKNNTEVTTFKEAFMDSGIEDIFDKAFERNTKVYDATDVFKRTPFGETHSVRLV